MTTIAVIDGMGSGIGAQIVTQLRQELPLDVEILALGANAVATDRMMQAKASRGASGENAIRVSINLADFIEIIGIEWKALTKQISAAIAVVRERTAAGR